jgi:hypothetical protein
LLAAGENADSDSSSEDTSANTDDSTEHTADSTEHTADSTEHTTDSTEHTTESTEHTADSTEHTADSIEHTTDSTEHATDSTEHTTDSTEHATDSTEHRSEPGSSAIFLDAAAQPSPVDSNTVKLRNTALLKQLSDKHLTYVDVTGDGNCFYRALSYTLYGNESQHVELRRQVADHIYLHHARIFRTSSDITPAERASIDQSVQLMRTNRVWAGEEAILAAADFLQRELHVFKYVTSVGTSPSVYAPVSVSGSELCSPLRLAFFEPGHFQAVFSDTTPVARSARRRNHHVRS